MRTFFSRQAYALDLLSRRLGLLTTMTVENEISKLLANQGQHVVAPAQVYSPMGQARLGCQPGTAALGSSVLGMHCGVIAIASS